MAKRHIRNPEATIARFKKQGRGQGTGAEWGPWYHVQDMSSKGLVSRIQSWKNKRTVHIFSNLELDFFYTLEWSTEVTDIREQYPLALDETITIARLCKLRHPCFRGTDKPRILTTDFVITTVTPSATSLLARSVLHSAGLKSTRLRPQLEIERRYWQANGIDWAVVTEHDIPRVLARNVAIFHSHRDIADRVSISPIEIEELARFLTDDVSKRSLPLRAITAQSDRQFEFPPGTSLAVAYHLLATRRWQIDMAVPIEPGKRLTLLSFDGVLCQ